MSIQLPSAALPLFDKDGYVRPDWQAFLQGVYYVAFNSTLSGATASRPTSELPGRWIGMPYYDTTLGFTVYLDSVNPDVWHDGAGNVV